MTTIAFDVDGTLIHLTGEKEDTPRREIIQLFLSFQQLGYEMYCWSGGGESYAEMWLRRLYLDAKVVEKGSFLPDIAVDDEHVKLGKVNLKV